MIVIGAGVIGLTTAIRLAQAGMPVEIVAKDSPLQTVSAKAAAFWTPFHVDGARDSWARRSLEEFQRLATDRTTGIREIEGVEYFESKANMQTWLDRSWWRHIPSVHYNVLSGSELPRGFVRGVGFTVPVIHMTHYLRWLIRQVRKLGVKISHENVKNINDLATRCGLVVNATGIEAHSLVKDNRMYGLRGQVVCIKPLRSIRRLVFCTTGRYEHEQPLYIVPRGSDVLLGGTADEVPANHVPVLDPDVTRGIIERCSLAQPELARLQPEDILEEKIGVRPCRKESLRLESDTSWNVPVVHAYGHGGAGVTYSWGTADEVVRLVDEVIAINALRRVKSS